MLGGYTAAGSGHSLDSSSIFLGLGMTWKFFHGGKDKSCAFWWTDFIQPPRDDSYKRKELDPCEGDIPKSVVPSK